MTLQHIIFPSPSSCTEEQMYFRRSEQAIYQWTDDFILFNQNDSCGFDTYFNGFSLEKWVKYTSIKKLCLTLKLKGSFRVTIMRKEKLPNETTVEYLEETVCNCNDNDSMDFTFELSTLKSCGMICFSLLALENGSVFYGGEYSSHIDSSDINEINMRIIICSYKREEFLLANIKRLYPLLSQKGSELYGHIKLIISDNSQTLDETAFDKELITVVKNINTGGSGGFTRGLIEALDQSKYTKISHVLLMDDDIILEPEVIFTTYTLLSILKKEYLNYFVGGSMLRSDRRFFQTEAGGLWNNGDLISLKSGLDLRELDACLFCELEEKSDFNAWWYCVMPLCVISNENLPLPLFIRGDDVEYGLRNMKGLILLNRICVWHEPFENKYSSSTFYYIFRNTLIANALHMKRFHRFRFIKKLILSVFRELVFYRYKNARLILKGIFDFYKGTDFLKETDAVALNDELISLGYKLLYAEQLEIPFSYTNYILSENQRSGGFFGRIFRIVTINGLLFPAYKEVTVSVSNPRPVNFLFAKRALNYDFNSKKGFVTQKCIPEAFSCMYLLFKACIKIIFRTRKTIKDYRKNISNIQNINFWKKYLKL